MVKVVLHTSDSTWGNAATIALWHGLPKSMNGRGWSAIGYHRVILNGRLAPNMTDLRFDGHIETGRPLDSDNEITPKERGAHVFGHNSNSVGICLIGKSGDFTASQMLSLYEELFELEKQFGGFELYQHSDLDKRKPHCAGLDLELVKKNYQHYKNNL